MNTSMLFTAYAHQSAKNAQQSAEVAKSMTERQRDEIEGLEQKVDHLSLVCQAMWELIRDHTEFQEEELEQKVIEIDLRDGHLDGKIKAKVIQCPQCGRNNNTSRRNCVICGARLTKDHIFEN